jgi:outer membrane protein assembly factor BamE
MQKLLITLFTLSVLWVSGCGLPSSWVYKIDVQQGTVVTGEMLAKLRPGMEKREVAAVLGTPLLIDPFHPQEWVYVYTEQAAGGPREQRVVKVHFEKDRLTRVGGDVRTATAAGR